MEAVDVSIGRGVLELLRWVCNALQEGRQLCEEHNRLAVLLLRVRYKMSIARLP
jgi:hypothetical protein